MSEEKILIALKEIHARYCIPASEQNYTDKDYACMQYEKLIIHLQKELNRLNNIIDELEKWLEENIKISKAHDNNLGVNVASIFLDKLKELKENNNE